MTIQILTAIAAVSVSLLGSIVGYYKLRSTQKSWEHGQKISIEKELLFEKLKKRHLLYSKTFKLLGEVRDIEYPPNHYIELENNKQKLITIADKLLDELYGEAGLFMEYETRTAILKAYQNSYKYANEEIILSDLVDSYYLARRFLRKDLEFDDTVASKSITDILKDKKTEIKESHIMKEKSFWAIKGVLAQSSRPGYPNKMVTSKTLKSTVEEWQKKNIKSVICLLSNKEINEYYRNINGGLLAYYKTKNINVIHIPVEDFLSPALSDENLETILSNYKALPKPILIHCGAGEDRTGSAIHTICEL
jgi:hypothetical protein